ncbi:MAG: hypothetical protein NC221_08875, partial [Duncaniella sp.]|nr:hypothetical protein [Duncaniella sp.]
SHDILREVRRDNGKPQTEAYTVRTPMEKWMRSSHAGVTFVYDSCGCGVGNLSKTPDIFFPIYENPVKKMTTAIVTPPIVEEIVGTFEGKARVQFEVDRFELHDSIYVCRSGQRIDNRDQLKMIDDTIKRALSDPNLEIAEIAVCGYASPESPYLHNEYLATNRSRALAEYLADRYNLPRERTSYSSVPENWGEFREQVLNSNEITDQQRKDLLELIDRPAYGPSDYDAKEKELATSPKFAKLYREKIRPHWFPQLRATTFAIKTKLKTMSDEELAKVFESNPGMLSLNQFFRVARLYPQGSAKYNEVIARALVKYPDNEIANLNAAAAAVNAGNYDRALELLKKAGDSPEAANIRGIIATAKDNLEEAERQFDKASVLPQAQKNKVLLESN